MSDDLTTDRFLGGRLEICQPRSGYRAGTDAVFLAAAVPAKAGATVLELGCGVGTAALCLAARVPGLSITGVELQTRYGDLARRNAAAAGADLKVITADIHALPADLRAQTFDHVFANPPYFETERLTPPQDAGKDLAHVAPAGALREWIDTGLKRLAPRGHICLIHRAEHLAQSLVTLEGKCGAIEIFPIVSRAGRPAERVILRARKGAATPLVLHPPFVVHDGQQHSPKGSDYTQRAEEILRHGAPFP